MFYCIKSRHTKNGCVVVLPLLVGISGCLTFTEPHAVESIQWVDIISYVLDFWRYFIYLPMFTFIWDSIDLFHQDLINKFEDNGKRTNTITVV